MTQTVDRIPVPEKLPELVLSLLQTVDCQRAAAVRAARAVAVCEAAVLCFPALSLKARTFAYNSAALGGKAGSLKALVPLFRFLKHQGWPPTPKHEDDPDAGMRRWCLRSEKGPNGKPLDADIWLEVTFKETSGVTCRYEVVGQELADVTELVCYDEHGKRVRKPTSLEVPKE